MQAWTLVARIARTAVAAMLAAFPAVGSAWEADVHRGLTEWLARKAGFTNEQAAWIAKGAQGVDQSPFTSPILGTIAATCLSKDANGSRTVQQHHFAAAGVAPSTPKARSVEAGRVFLAGIPRPIPVVAKLEEGPLGALGDYLHALQDSWSHQGEPDPPEFCDERLAWGHGRKRGGWPCHLADTTHPWVDADVVPMAKATYDVLVAAGAPGKAMPWPDLVPAVRSFAEAGTKWDKDRWFALQDLAPRDFLQLSSLPDCLPGKNCVRYPFDLLLTRWQAIAANPPRIDGLPVELVRVVTGFLDALVRQGAPEFPSGFVEQRLAEAALSRATRVQLGCPGLWTKYVRFHFMNAFRDGHGAHQPLALCMLAAKVAAVGTGAVACEAAERALDEADKLAARRGPGLAEMVERIGKRPAYTFTATSDGKSLLAEAQFPHLPRDRLVMRAAHVGGDPKNPKITELVWMPAD
jgi:hypothetical protein